MAQSKLKNGSIIFFLSLISIIFIMLLLSYDFHMNFLTEKSIGEIESLMWRCSRGRKRTEKLSEYQFFVIFLVCKCLKSFAFVRNKSFKF